MNTSTPEAPKDLTPLKILLIGPPGSRKTTLGLQFPDVLVEDCDRNLDGPERYIRKHVNPKLSYSYDSIRYDDKKQPVPIEDCYNRLCDKLRLVNKTPEYAKIRTVFVDSLSHVNEFIIRDTLKAQGKTKNVGDMEARDWGPFKSRAYQLLVARLEETNRTILCSCHEIKLTESDKQNIMVQTVIGYEPFFQGKVGDTIGAFFTDVWRMDVQQAAGGKTKTILQTIRHPKCEHLKNSIGMPAELDITEGYKVIEPYLNGSI
jgi:AAA domain